MSKGLAQQRNICDTKKKYQFLKNLFFILASSPSTRKRPIETNVSSNNNNNNNNQIESVQQGKILILVLYLNLISLLLLLQQQVHHRRHFANESQSTVFEFIVMAK